MFLRNDLRNDSGADGLASLADGENASSLLGQRGQRA